jgi:hypothetical protein
MGARMTIDLTKAATFIRYAVLGCQGCNPLQILFSLSGLQLG